MSRNGTASRAVSALSPRLKTRWAGTMKRMSQKWLFRFAEPSRNRYGVEDDQRREETHACFDEVGDGENQAGEFDVGKQFRVLEDAVGPSRHGLTGEMENEHT